MLRCRVQDRAVKLGVKTKVTHDARVALVSPGNEQSLPSRAHGTFAVASRNNLRRVGRRKRSPRPGFDSPKVFDYRTRGTGYRVCPNRVCDERDEQELGQLPQQALRSGRRRTNAIAHTETTSLPVRHARRLKRYRKTIARAEPSAERT